MIGQNAINTMLGTDRWRCIAIGHRGDDHLARLPTFRLAQGFWPSSVLALSGLRNPILLIMGCTEAQGLVGGEFGVHITADQLLAAGADLKEALP